MQGGGRKRTREKSRNAPSSGVSGSADEVGVLVVRVTSLGTEGEDVTVSKKGVNSSSPRESESEETYKKEWLKPRILPRCKLNFSPHVIGVLICS